MLWCDIMYSQGAIPNTILRCIMKHKTMANLLRAVIVLLVGCGLFMHIWWIPNIVRDSYSLEFVTVEWVTLTSAALIPCYAVTVIAWLIADSISKEREFCHRNAALFRWVFGLALGDSALFLLASIVLYATGRAYIWCVFTALPLAALGICVAICAAVLSHLIDRAADLQEDSDLTI